MKKILAFIVIFALCVGATACGEKNDGVLVVGASPAPHAEILEIVKPILEKQGITLEIKEFTDYFLPNTALQNGDIDANYFQHLPYLIKFNTENKTELSTAGSIHFEPLAIYSGKSADLANIPSGAQIAIPNDATNGARALLLLEKEGIITLSGKGLESTVLDITGNPQGVEIKELEAAQIPNALVDVDFAVINGNYAIGAGIAADKMLATENSESDAAEEFANIIAVKTGNESNENIKALVNALKSDEVKSFIAEKYQGNVLPVK